MIEAERIVRVAMPAVDLAMSLLPKQMDTPEARVMMYAISLQESALLHRAQVLNGGGKGPARGLWQFEQGGGCRGVVNHEASRYWMSLVCKARGCPFDHPSLWRMIETDDALAAAAARLLLFTDPKPLPELGQSDRAWSTYTWNWRPGKPHPQTWDKNYRAAMSVVVSGSM